MAVITEEKPKAPPLPCDLEFARLERALADIHDRISDLHARRAPIQRNHDRAAEYLESWQRYVTGLDLTTIDELEATRRFALAQISREVLDSVRPFLGGFSDENKRLQVERYEAEVRLEDYRRELPELRKQQIREAQIREARSKRHDEILINPQRPDEVIFRLGGNETIKPVSSLTDKEYESIFGRPRPS
jgi:septal ring factor EnvC (AmiA/AmiB activator)